MVCCFEPVAAATATRLLLFKVVSSSPLCFCFWNVAALFELLCFFSTRAVCCIRFRSAQLLVSFATYSLLTSNCCTFASVACECSSSAGALSSGYKLCSSTRLAGCCSSSALACRSKCTKTAPWQNLRLQQICIFLMKNVLCLFRTPLF